MKMLKMDSIVLKQGEEGGRRKEEVGGERVSYNLFSVAIIIITFSKIKKYKLFKIQVRKSH